MKFGSEFSFALECCRRSFRTGSASSFNAPTELDWAHFLRLVRFHRIEGLAWNALAKLEVTPKNVRSDLSDAARAIAVHNLRASAECSKLLDQFETAKVPLVFLKGLTLGALAYGNPAIKSAIDVDLLIDRGDLGKAAELLHAAGYQLIAPEESANDETLRAWHLNWKESVWIGRSGALQLDLHTRTADNRHLIPTIEAKSSRQWVDVGGGSRLPTLAEDELLTYLAVHGASSAWFRLKWICDFAALLHGRSEDEVDRLYRRSQELGAGRAAGQALLLADTLFGSLMNASSLRDELQSDRATRRLHRAALRLLTGELSEPTDERWGTLTIHWTQFLLLPGIRYKISELKRQALRLR